jgi:hypothetical protein
VNSEQRRKRARLNSQIEQVGVQHEMEPLVEAALLTHGPGLRAYPSLHGKLKACACASKECREFRQQYNFGDATVRVTNSDNWPEDRQRRHFRALGKSEAETKALVERVAMGKDVRIATWHYYGSDRELQRGRWVIKALTQNPRQLHLGRRRTINSPLPNRSVGSNADGDGGADSPNYRAHPDWRPLEAPASTPMVAGAASAAVAYSDRTARLQARVSVASAQPPQLQRTPEKPQERKLVALKVSPDDKRRGADSSRPWWGMTCLPQLRLLTDILNDHYTQDSQHGGCPGQHSEDQRSDGRARYAQKPRITWRPSWDSTHGTCLCLHGECTACGQTFRWDSQPRSEATGNFMGNDLIGAAVAASPVTVTHAQYFIALLMMQPPAAKTIRSFVYEHAAPVLHSMWEEQQEEMFARIRHTDGTTGRTIILEFDMSFSCVRSAEHSTASCVDAETGLVLWKAVFSEGEAATREPLACREGLELFKSKGIDVGAMVIDDSNCRVIIEATQRGQAATEAQRRQFIKVLLDVWHSKKNGKPEMEKYLNGDDSSALDRFLKGFEVECDAQGRVLTDSGLVSLLDLISAAQAESFKRDFSVYFAAIESLSDEQRTSWEEMKDDPEMHADALKAMLADETAEHSNPNVRDSVTEAEYEALRVELNALRCDRNEKALHRARRKAEGTGGVFDPSEVTLQQALSHVDQFRLNSVPVPAKAELLAIIRALHRRYSSSSNTVVMADGQSLTLDSKKGGITVGPANELVRECLASATGMGMPASTALAELCRAIDVSEIIASLPMKATSVSAAASCHKADVQTVLSRARSETIKKKASYFDSFGHFCRIVNEVWGTAQQKFKAFWVLQALQNVPRHYAGDHTDCACYMWFSRWKERACGPISRRDTSLGWDNLPLSHTMSKQVVKIATIMMNDYTLSNKMRHRTYRTVLFGRTSRNESWNHALRVFSAMYSHLSRNQEELNATVVTLIWNELTKHKVHALGTSKIEPRATKGKGKLRKKGRLAPVRQPRPLVMSWHIDMYAKLFGAEVQWWCKHHNDHLHQLREKRRQKGEQLQAQRDDTLAGASDLAALRAIEASQRSGEGALKQEFKPVLGVYCKIPKWLRKARAFLYRPPWPLRYPVGVTPPVIDLAAAADDAAQEANGDLESPEPASDDENFEEPVADVESAAAAAASGGAAAAAVIRPNHSGSSSGLDEAEPMQEDLVDGLPGV